MNHRRAESKIAAVSEPWRRAAIGQEFTGRAAGGPKGTSGSNCHRPFGLWLGRAPEDLRENPG